MGHTIYDSLYVNRLYSGVKRHLSKPFRFVCFTDDSNGSREEVETFPIPEGINLEALSRCAVSRKLHLFHPNINGLEGTCLYFDLDVVLIVMLSNVNDGTNITSAKFLLGMKVYLML